MRSAVSLLAALLCLFNGSAFAYTLELTPQQLQENVSGYFPYQQRYAFSSITLSDPKISLNERSDRIGVELTVKAVLPGVMDALGRGQINGKLEYRAETGEFYLRDPKLTRVQIANLPEQYNDAVNELVGQMSTQPLPLILVYRLEDSGLKQLLVKNTLKSAVVRNGKLVLELGLP